MNHYMRNIAHPITVKSAINRIHNSGLTVNEAMQMEDDDLLRLPTIGRKTLAWLRTFQPIQ